MADGVCDTVLGMEEVIDICLVLLLLLLGTWLEGQA